MKGKKNDQSKIIMGAVIGGLIGGAAYYLLSRKTSKPYGPLLDKVTEVLSELGDELENSEILNTGISREIEQSKDNNTIDDALTLITTGLTLWNKIKRG
jgi:hypothetical protein